MASTRLTRTFGSTGNRQKWTWSAWVKRHDFGSDEAFFSCYVHANDKFQAYFDSTDRLNVWFYNGTSYNIATKRKFRDAHGWYHIVLRIDTTHGTANNRFRVYVNGVEESDRETNNQPTQNLQMSVNQAETHYISSDGNGNNNLNAALSHVHFLDGEDRDGSYFGQTDATTGEWTIKTNPTGINYGTNGFFILKDGNSLTDQSGNSNNWAVNTGTLTKTEDNPSNVFATLNPLGPRTDAGFTNGNTKVTFGTASNRSIVSTTLGAFNGRYYWEIKIGGSVSPNNLTPGVGTKYQYDASANAVGSYAETWGIQPWNGNVMNNGSSVGGTWATFTSGDIVQIAINLIDEQGGLNKLYFGKNGTWLNGADPSNHSSTTGVVGITKPENGSSGFVFPLFGDGGSSATPAPEVNFGNGYFGTTAVSSAGTNASNNGIFEYDVPTGFTALSTKGFNL